MLKDYFLLAFKNVKKRGIRSWLTMLGIFLGIAAVVSLISLGAGLQNAITGQFGELDADKLVVQNAGTGFGPPGSTVVEKLTDRDVALVESVDGVKLVVPRLIRIVKFESDEKSNFRSVTSLPSQKNKLDLTYDFFNTEVMQGKLLSENDRGKVILGNHFVKDEFTRLKVGDNVLIQEKKFEVYGILEESSNLILNHVILMPEQDLKDLLDIHNQVDLIVVQVEDKNKLQSVADEMARKFRRDRKLKVGEEDFSIQTPLQNLSAINTILGIINIIVSGIASISLLIGGIGIANTMYTSVLERTKEIGVMKAIGGKSGSILFVFLLESGLLGLIGGIVGAVIGLGLALMVSSIASSFLGGIDFRVTLSIPLIIGAIGFSLFIGIVSGIFPALQAARMNPVEALRK
jgi:putative ABC transport system permease protein